MQFGMFDFETTAFGHTGKVAGVNGASSRQAGAFSPSRWSCHSVSLISRVGSLWFFPRFSPACGHRSVIQTSEFDGQVPSNVSACVLADHL